MQVVELQPYEVVRLDTERLDALYRALGDGGGEAVLCTAMEDLAHLLQEVKAAWLAADVTGVHLRSAEIAGIADRVGMVALAQVASDVTGLCWWYQEAALAAAVARLQRLGEQSLLEVWYAEEQMM